MQISVMSCQGDAKFRAPTFGRDGGSTFIEILVAVVLLGIGGIAVLTAVAAAATSAAVGRDVADVQAALATAADAVEAADPERDTYVPCARPDEYDGLVSAHGVEVLSVEYWTGARWSVAADECAHDDGERLQRVTIRAAVDDTFREVAVVKRPAEEPTADLGALVTTPGGSSELGAASPTPTPGVTGPVDDPSDEDDEDDHDAEDDEDDDDEDDDDDDDGRSDRWNARFWD